MMIMVVAVVNSSATMSNKYNLAVAQSPKLVLYSMTNMLPSHSGSLRQCGRLQRSRWPRSRVAWQVLNADELLYVDCEAPGVHSGVD